MTFRIRSFIWLLMPIACMLAGCSSKGNRERGSSNYLLAYSPKHASGFSVYYDSISGHTKVTVEGLWQGAKGAEGKDSIEIPAPVSRIVATSSTHVAMLDALGESSRVVGVSGLKYISSPRLLKRIGDVADIGYENSLDYEKLISLHPDVVLLYGINGASLMEGKLRDLGIPFLYIGDYLEHSPLGKAEWMVAVGALVGKRAEAVHYVDSVARNYRGIVDAASAAAGIAGKKPTVMLNTPYGESWFMPGGGNYMNRLIRDANGIPAYAGEPESNESVAVDAESVLLLTSRADIWLNTTGYHTLDQLKQSLGKYAGARPLATGEVYSNEKRSTTNGGNDFYESGAVHPDMVLADIVRIFYPGSLPSSSLTYYFKLQ